MNELVQLTDLLKKKTWKSLMDENQVWKYVCQWNKLWMLIACVFLCKHHAIWDTKCPRILGARSDFDSSWQTLSTLKLRSINRKHDYFADPKTPIQFPCDFPATASIHNHPLFHCFPASVTASLGVFFRSACSYVVPCECVVAQGRVCP